MHTPVQRHGKSHDHDDNLQTGSSLVFFREGTNALDAAFLAYSGISVLRQQMKPDHRIHGIVLGKDWSSNGMFTAQSSCLMDA